MFSFWFDVSLLIVKSESTDFDFVELIGISADYHPTSILNKIPVHPGSTQYGIFRTTLNKRYCSKEFSAKWAIVVHYKMHITDISDGSVSV